MKRIFFKKCVEQNLKFSFINNSIVLVDYIHINNRFFLIKTLLRYKRQNNGKIIIVFRIQRFIVAIKFKIPSNKTVVLVNRKILRF